MNNNKNGEVFAGFVVVAVIAAIVAMVVFGNKDDQASQAVATVHVVISAGEEIPTPNDCGGPSPTAPFGCQRIEVRGSADQNAVLGILAAQPTALRVGIDASVVWVDIPQNGVEPSKTEAEWQMVVDRGLALVSPTTTVPTAATT